MEPNVKMSIPNEYISKAEDIADQVRVELNLQHWGGVVSLHCAGVFCENLEKFRVVMSRHLIIHATTGC